MKGDSLFRLWLEAILDRKTPSYNALHLSVLLDLDRVTGFDPEVPEIARVGMRRWRISG